MLQTGAGIAEPSALALQMNPRARDVCIALGSNLLVWRDENHEGAARPFRTRGNWFYLPGVGAFSAFQALGPVHGCISGAVRFVTPQSWVADATGRLLSTDFRLNLLYAPS